MTDYSKLSDFEINRLVARAIDGLHGDDRTACDCYLEAGFGSAVKIPDGDIGWFIIDYCNNPADAWPIIVTSKIWLREMYGMWDCKGFSTPPHPAGQVSSSDANPLRAAMIVFLMMKERK